MKKKKENYVLKITFFVCCVQQRTNDLGDRPHADSV